MKLSQTKKDGQQADNQKLISENLAFLLKQHNLNSSQLAHCIGIPMMTIRRLLSGETEDPRISTLKLIADYFNISIDLLINGNPRDVSASLKKIKSYLIPKVNWEILSTVDDIEKMTFNDWNDWQSITLPANEIISKNTFALESRPSMYPRFPKGTIFIIDPETTPADGDIVLIKLKENNEFTLRELIIDPPDWRLTPLVSDSSTINFSTEKHEAVGVSFLTMLYNPKIIG